jgi:hypothetical protein
LKRIVVAAAGLWPAVIVACSASSTYPPPLGDCDGGVCVVPKMDATTKHDVAISDTGAADTGKPDAPVDAAVDVLGDAKDAASGDSSATDASDASDAPLD